MFEKYIVRIQEHHKKKERKVEKIFNGYYFSSEVKNSYEIVFKCPSCGAITTKAKAKFETPLSLYSFKCRKCKLKETLSKNKEEILEKRKNTNKERYGFEHPMQNNEIREKQENTMLSQYGVKNSAQKEGFREKLIYSRGNSSAYNKKKNHYLNLEEIKGAKPLFSFSEYNGSKNYHDFYRWQCKECGAVFYANLYSGNIPSCPFCNASFRSSQEKKLVDFLKNFTDEVEVNKRFTSNGIRRELDVYLPNYHFGVEIDGIYWHSERNGTSKRYHIEKSSFFKELGIDILHFFDTEVENKFSIVASIIKAKLGFLKDKIYARNTRVSEITSKQADAFLYDNHLQGSVKNKSFSVGLFYDNEIVAVMTFGKNRFSHQNEWEIYRFAYKKDLHIIGGFSKMLALFEREKEPQKIVTFADRRYSKGLVYAKNGFSFEYLTEPNYFYFKGDKLFSRVKFQKHKLSEELNYFDENLTEWENMKANGFDRIWDCGNVKFSKRIC